ncbi:MAG: hypothetical protein ACI875_001572, partial [Planctomycetota bacterium]
NLVFRQIVSIIQADFLIAHSALHRSEQRMAAIRVESSWSG